MQVLMCGNADGINHDRGGQLASGELLHKSASNHSCDYRALLLL